MLRRLRPARKRLARRKTRVRRGQHGRKTRVRRGQDAGALRAGARTLDPRRGSDAGKTRVDVVPSYFLAVLYLQGFGFFKVQKSRCKSMGSVFLSEFTITNPLECIKDNPSAIANKIYTHSRVSISLF